MNGDLIAYLSGNIPGGIYLLLVGIVAFAVIWWLVWHGTKFWNVSRFFMALMLGWVIITGVYVIAWRRSQPPPLPIRVVVSADDSGDHPKNWRLTGLEDIIGRRLDASAKHFVLQRSTIIPLLNRSGFDEARMDSLAFRLRAHWLVTVLTRDDGPGAGMSVKVKKRDHGGFKLIAVLPVNEGRFCAEGAKISGEVARLLGDDAAPKARFGLPMNLPDRAFADLYTAMELRRIQAYDSAITVFSGLTQSYPGWHRPYQELAATHLVHFGSYRKETIHSLLITALELDPSDPESYILMGRLFLRFCDWVEAEAALKLALNQTVDDPRIFYYLSKLGRERLKDLPYGGRNELKYRALELAPGYEDARLSLAESYRDLLDRYNSVAVLEEGLAIDPESVPLLLSKAANLVEMGYND
ncbi:MAG TPA: hypothetical protein ENL08_06235, partial [Bacteroidetes bacterium]|nr:hypothetical protein [Bacteroidota bacterium]